MNILMDRQVTFKRPNFFKRLINSVKISLKKGKKETINLWVIIKNGTNYTEPIQDLIYKDNKGTFKTIVTKVTINDELPNECIYTDSKGLPYIRSIYNNGDGRLKFLKFDGDEFEDVDIRANDVYEQTATKLMKLLDPMKENRLLMMMFVMAMVGMGIFFMLGLNGLGSVINKGIETVVAETANNIRNIPAAP